MIEFNSDFKYIQKSCPAYIPIFKKLNKDLLQKYGLELGMELTNHSNSRLRFWLKSPIKINQKLGKEANPEAQLLIDQLETQLKETCSQCGCTSGVLFNTYLYNFKEHDVDQMNLCETCSFTYRREEFKLSVTSFTFWNRRNSLHNKLISEAEQKPYNPKIRFIGPLDDFDYAKFGSYFFHKGESYVKTDKENYGAYNVNKQFIDTIFWRYNALTESIIKVIYAGHDTGFRDDEGIRIFTGDIIKMKGSMTNERDPQKYFKKDRYRPKSGEHQYEVYGVVSWSFDYNAYQVILDNHGAFLCHGTRMEVLGNIFYDLEPEQPIDIWGAGCCIAQSGYNPTGFWNKHSRETIKEDLKNVKTPHFLNK